MSEAPLRETPLNWVKSSFSRSNGNCVQVAALPAGGVAVRDSKNPSGPTLTFTPAEWVAFLNGVHGGEFGHLAH